MHDHVHMHVHVHVHVLWNGTPCITLQEASSAAACHAYAVQPRTPHRSSLNVPTPSPTFPCPRGARLS